MFIRAMPAWVDRGYSCPKVDRLSEMKTATMGLGNSRMPKRGEGDCKGERGVLAHPIPLPRGAYKLNYQMILSK